jgi:hypothetical protein
MARRSRTEATPASSRSLRLTRTHGIAAALVCLVIPGLSWLDGSGWLAWNMFSKSATYRLRVLAHERSGESRAIAATALAVHADPVVGRWLAGSEAFRHAPVGSTIRRELRDIAALGCRAAEEAERIDVWLEERETLDAPVRTSHAEATCAQ